VCVKQPKSPGMSGWLARAWPVWNQDSSASAVYRKFEVLVLFPTRVRISHNSRRMELGVRGWEARLQGVNWAGKPIQLFLDTHVGTWLKSGQLLFGAGFAGVLSAPLSAQLSEEHVFPGRARGTPCGCDDNTTALRWRAMTNAEREIAQCAYRLAEVRRALEWVDVVADTLRGRDGLCSREENEWTVCNT
jgi:hypothetical protein